MGFGSFYSAISGLRGHLFSMNVIGNNIANSNTPGFKSNRTTFREALVQTLRGASAPQSNLGGQNAIQVGLGMEVASVDTNRSQGVLQSTGIVTDLGVDGEGYFIVASGADQFYTRAGTFVFDRNGALVTRGTGHLVQGWVADGDGRIPTGAPLAPLQLPLDLRIPGQATTEVSLKANLNAAATESVASLGSAGTTGVTFISGNARDGSGGQHSVAITGANATASTATGANLTAAGALTGAESLASLGVTNASDFAISVDGNTAIAVTGLTAASTVSDLVAAINNLGAGVEAEIVGGEVQLSRSFHGEGAVYNVATSNGVAGNISNRIFGAAAGSAFTANNGAASSLTAIDTFTPTGRQAMSPVTLDIEYDAVTGLATGLEGLGTGGVTVTARDGLAAGTLLVDTEATEHLASVLVYDSLGNTHTMNMTFTRSATPNTWSWRASFDGGEAITGGGTGQVVFNTDGSIQSWSHDGGASGLSMSAGPATDPMELTFQTGTPAGFDGLTQFASAFTARANAQDGYATGSLSTISIDQYGVIAGHFSNGVLRSLGQVVLARFNNPDGLERVSGSLYQASLNSTEAIVGAAGSSIPATIQAGTLEGSNVDLSEEFVSMIVAQRGFQANARVITTGDQLMGDLINLKQ